MGGYARRRIWEIPTPKGSLAVVEVAAQMAQNGLAHLALWVQSGELTQLKSTKDWPEWRNKGGSGKLCGRADQPRSWPQGPGVIREMRPKLL